MDGAGRTNDPRGAAIVIPFLVPGTTVVSGTGIGKFRGAAALGAGPKDFPGAAVLGAALLSASGAADVMAPKKDGNGAFNSSASLASDGGAVGVTCEFFDHDRTSISLAALPAEFGDEGDERLKSWPNCDGELMSEEGGSGPFANDAPASSIGSHTTITSSVADKANMITLSHPHPTTTRKGVVVDGGGRGGDFEKTATSDADFATENAATYLTGWREDNVCGTANLRARGGRLRGCKKKRIVKKRWYPGHGTRTQAPNPGVFYSSRIRASAIYCSGTRANMLPGGAGRPRSRPFSETTLCLLAFTFAESVTERDEVDGNTDTLATCAHTAPLCGHGESTLSERDAADGNAHALAHCAGTARPPGLGASTVGLVSAVEPKMACDAGKITTREEVAEEWTLIQVAATSLSTPS